jgi:hypothetical protein
LVVLESGAVVQNFLEQTKAEVEQDALRRHGALLLSVVPVPGIERALTVKEIAKVLAGKLAKQPTPVMDGEDWLRRLAAHLGASLEYLLKQGFLDRHDLVEQQHQLPKDVACLIRSNPAWHAPPVAH